MNDEAISEKILGEERVFDGRLVKVNRLDVVLPSGKRTTREAVRHPGASAIVPVDAEGRVTLVRQYRTALARVLLEIPAGKLDSPDEDRLAAAQRELREETGLTAQSWTHLTDMASTPGFCDEVISIYLATELTSGGDDPDDDEFLDVVKLPLQTLLESARRGELTDAKTLVGLMLAEKRLGERG